MVRGALALDLDEHERALDVLAVPSIERLEQLQTCALRVHLHRHLPGLLDRRRRLVRVLPCVSNAHRTLTRSYIKE